MTFLIQWQNQLPSAYAEFARLAIATPEIEVGPGLIGTAILWPVRQALQKFDGEALDAVRKICGPEAKHIFKVIQGWRDDPLTAARDLITRTQANSPLAEALNKLNQHFQAAAPFAEAVAQALVEKQDRGDVYNNIAGQIKAALINIGGSTTIQSLTLNLNLGNTTPPIPVYPRAVAESELATELLRLDVAAPNRVTLNQVFELAVAIRQRSSPILNEDDLPQLRSGDVQVSWPESESQISLRLEVNAPECELHSKNSYSFRLYRGQDSPIFYFQLTPKTLGKISIIIVVYQEDNWLGSARIHTIAEEKVGEVQVKVKSYSVTQRFQLKNIRTLLTEGFTDGDLRRLCYDEPQFRPVYDQLAQEMGKDRIIDKLIEHAERYELMEVLLRVAKEFNSAKFEKYQPYYYGQPSEKVATEKFFLPFEPETILIPAGSFIMGSDKDEPHEAPRHTVILPDYRIGKYPVTNKQYAEFIRQTGHIVNAAMMWDGQQPPQDKLEYPVVGVTWYEVLAYCQWLSKTTGRNYTLPSEAEWEKAARSIDGRRYPWGNEWEENRCNPYSDTLTSVASYPPQNEYGCCDMVGNSREWTRTVWGSDPDVSAYSYPWTDQDGSDDLTAPTHFRRIYRGGAADDHAGLRCSRRDSFLPDKPGPRRHRHGFRVVLLFETL